MDSTKKRKLDEDGFNGEGDYLKLYPADARKMIERFPPDQLIDILQDAVVRHPDVLSAVRAVADLDESQRTLFIRGLGWDTTTDGLRSLFSTFGDLEEAVVIHNKGYGLVTFCHVDSALLALREPSKRIDGGFAIAAGNSGSNTNAADIAIRKVYVYNVPPDLPAENLLAHFSNFGEIEEGPLGFDKETGKSKGFALFVYKTPEGARAALEDPVNNVDGRRLIASCPFSLKALKDFPYSHRSSASFLEIYRENSPFLSPRVDSKETPEAHVFKVDLPGLKMEEVKLETEGDGVLQISGERSTGTEKEDKNELWHCVERSNGKFMRRFRLPEYVKMDQVKVAMENCVLTVTVPKVEIKEPDGYQNQHHPPSGVSPVPRVPPGSMYPNVPPYY